MLSHTLLGVWSLIRAGVIVSKKRPRMLKLVIKCVFVNNAVGDENDFDNHVWQRQI